MVIKYLEEKDPALKAIVSNIRLLGFMSASAMAVTKSVRWVGGLFAGKSKEDNMSRKEKPKPPTTPPSGIPVRGADPPASSRQVGLGLARIHWHDLGLGLGLTFYAMAVATACCGHACLHMSHNCLHMPLHVRGWLAGRLAYRKERFALRERESVGHSGPYAAGEGAAGPDPWDPDQPPRSSCRSVYELDKPQSNGPRHYQRWRDCNRAADTL